MREVPKKFPPYQLHNNSILQKSVMVSLDVEQVLEIANVFYHINRFLPRLPRFLGGLRLSEASRALHKSIHDAAINCAISMEKSAEFDKQGAQK